MIDNTGLCNEDGTVPAVSRKPSPYWNNSASGQRQKAIPSRQVGNSRHFGSGLPRCGGGIGLQPETVTTPARGTGEGCGHG